MKWFLTTFIVLTLPVAAFAQKSIPEGSRVYVAPMGGFETYFIAALNHKKVPVVIVGTRSTADFVVSGGAETEQANWMRIWVSGNWRSDEKASIVVKNLHSDVIVYAYEVNKWAAWNGAQSAAEACAKHMKNSIVRLSPEELAQFSATPREKAEDSAAVPGGEPMPIPGLGVSAGMRADGAVEIAKVDRHGLAEVSGLHVGDVINAVDGTDTDTPKELALGFANRAPGSKIRVLYTFHTGALGDQRKEVVMTVQDRSKQN
jgi:PDZ domain